jgi:putative DNA primase/helicase
LYKHLRASGSANHLAGQLETARSQPGIALALDQFDAQPCLLNVGNGTLDLHTGQLRKPSRDDLLTRGIQTVYDASARAPTFHAFLERVQPQAHLRAFLQRAAGYSLTGDVSERVLFLLHGSGANGKSTLVDLLVDLLENYATTVRPETLMVKRYADAIPNDIAALRDKRLVSSSELERTHRLDEPLVKRLTGGAEDLHARHMRGEWFNFAPRFKLWLDSNHLPIIRGTEQAIWDRVLRIPFEVSIPRVEWNRELATTLRGELEGVLAWAVEGCVQWRRDGLQPPPEVVAATTSYRDEQDWLGQFLDQHFELGDARSIAAQRLYNRYCGWCAADGSKPLPQTALGKLLRDRGFRGVRVRSDGNRHWWLGLALRDEIERQA